MNITEHLLVCITEECGEIVQAAGKALRFGLDDHAPGKEQTNLEDMAKEVNDLAAVIEVLNERGVIFPDQSTAWEPGAALPAERIQSLRTAHASGIETWVSLEPVLDPSETLRIVSATHPFVDSYKVGKLNHMGADIDWRRFAGDVVALMQSLGKSFYLKEDLRRFQQGD